MTTQLSHKEWETISAYLDGQLSERERSNFEARLRSRPELRDGMEELKHTRTFLRSLPPRHAPHNFTLTPSMVQPQRETPRFFPTLRFASALAGVLFVLVFIGELTLGKGATMAPATAFRPEAPQAAPLAGSTTNAAAAAPTTGESAPLIVTWGTPTPENLRAYGLGGGGGGGSEDIPLPQTTPEMGTMDLAATSAAPLQANPPLAPQATPTAEAGVGALAQNPQAKNSAGPILGILPTDQSGTEIVVPSEEQTPSPAPAPSSSALLWRLAEISLGAVAILTGLAAYLINRKASH